MTDPLPVTTAHGFDLLAVLVTAAALAAWINHRFVRLPRTIGVMVIALAGSVVLVTLGRAGIDVAHVLESTLEAVDFDDTLLNGMLGALLFAGSLHLDINDIARQKRVIALLATAGVLLSTAIIGVGSWWLFNTLGIGVPFMYCLLFGALISPTDPIAVGAILTRLGAPHSLRMKVQGESLFNDGIGVVLFVGLLGVASGGRHLSALAVAQLFLVEALGGLVYGAAIGWVVYRLLKSIDNYQVEILVTLGLVTGGYTLAQHLHVSGPLAMVVAGLLVGNRGRALAMSDRTRDRLDAFWELADEFLNAVLFVMIGMEVVVLELRASYIVAGMLIVPLVVLARFASVGSAVQALKRWRSFSRHAVKVITWSGLRGGISVALALSLPNGTERDLLVTVTYLVVCFSIVVQGLTIEPLLQRLYGSSSMATDVEGYR
jgi:CPA1 family monovalent cation:H+ antiporter